MSITHVPVQSSNITSVGYDPSSKTLQVAFAKSLYNYAGVPQRVYDALMASDSKGTYLAAHVKGTYKATKVG